MKNKKTLKLLSIIVMITILLAMATNVFALSDEDFLDLSGSVNTNTNTGTDTNTNTNLNTNTNTNINTNTNTTDTATNYNTNLPKAGVAENTMLGIALTVLGIVAVYAYSKVKYYKNI